jgi:hypothetical protein
LAGSGVPFLVVLGTNVFRWWCGGGGGGGGGSGSGAFFLSTRGHAACFLFELLAPKSTTSDRQTDHNN